MPKVSVVMPAYNAEKYISEAIESILNQTFTDFEFIIIDDGSIDDTVGIINYYNDDRIRLIQNEVNLGVAQTLNKGIELSRGQYIARMDADDISLPTRFEKQVAFLDVNPDVAVVGSDIELFGMVNEKRSFSSKHDDLKVELLFNNCFAHPSVMLNHKFFGSKKLLYNPKVNKMEDYDLWVRAAISNKLACISEVLLRYRVHPNQVTQSHSQEVFDQYIRIKKNLMNAIQVPLDDDFELFANSCCNNQHLEKEDIIKLVNFCDRIVQCNHAKNFYNQNILIKYIDSFIITKLNSLPRYDAKDLCEIAGISYYPYILRRFVKSGKIKMKLKANMIRNRMRLKNRRFTIISNNCWGGMIYQKYGIPYMSPTVGLFILGNDFVKLCSDWRSYFSSKLVFIPWTSTKYYHELKDQKPFPVAKLKDIEVYFMHYKTNEEAVEKWYRRVKRINPNHMLFKLSQREMCSSDDVKKFLDLPYPNKLCFAYEKIQGSIYVPELEGFIGDEYPLLEEKFDELEVLRKL